MSTPFLFIKGQYFRDWLYVLTCETTDNFPVPSSQAVTDTNATTLGDWHLIMVSKGHWARCWHATQSSRQSTWTFGTRNKFRFESNITNLRVSFIDLYRLSTVGGCVEWCILQAQHIWEFHTTLHWQGTHLI